MTYECSNGEDHRMEVLQSQEDHPCATAEVQWSSELLILSWYEQKGKKMYGTIKKIKTEMKAQWVSYGYDA